MIPKVFRLVYPAFSSQIIFLLAYIDNLALFSHSGFYALENDNLAF